MRSKKGENEFLTARIRLERCIVASRVILHMREHDRKTILNLHLCRLRRICILRKLPLEIYLHDWIAPGFRRGRWVSNPDTFIELSTKDKFLARLHVSLIAYLRVHTLFGLIFI